MLLLNNSTAGDFLLVAYYSHQMERILRVYRKVNTNHLIGSSKRFNAYFNFSFVDKGRHNVGIKFVN